MQSSKRAKPPAAKFPAKAAKRRLKRTKNKREGKNDKHEVELLRQLSTRKMPAPVRELAFHEGRRWRFDMAWARVKLAVEVEGGIYMGGRHVTPIGFTKDCEKYNAAQEDGWVVLRYVPEAIKDGSAVKQIESVYQQRVTVMKVLEYGEEVAFGSGDYRDALDRAFAERREQHKLAGLLLENHSRESHGVGEASTPGGGPADGLTGTKQKRPRKKSRDQQPAAGEDSQREQRHHACAWQSSTSTRCDHEHSDGGTGMSPFKSEAQRKYLFAKEPKVAREFAAATPKGKKLPEHVSKDKSKSKKGKS